MICLHTIKYFQIFASNTNNLWQIFKTNIDFGILTGIPTPCQSGPMCNDNEFVSTYFPKFKSCSHTTGYN